MIGLKSAVTLFLQGSGLPHGDLLATGEDGDFYVDLSTGEHRAKLKVNESEADGTKTYRIFGTLEDANRVKEGLVRKYGEAIEVALPQKPTASDRRQPPMLEMNISLDLVQVRRLIAKTALSALTYLQGDSFVSSSQAVWLRQVLDAPRDWPEAHARPQRPDSEGDAAINQNGDAEALMGQLRDRFARAGDPLPDKEARACHLAIVPMPGPPDQKRTLFAMSLPGFVLPGGLVAPGTPPGMWAPVVLTETEEGPLGVRDLARGLPNGM
jgi:hypothetical protein